MVTGYLILDVTTKLWDDLVRTKSIFLVVLIGIVIVLYRIFTIINDKRNKVKNADEHNFFEKKVFDDFSDVMRFGKEKLDEVIRKNIEHGHTEVAIKVFVKYVKSLNEDDSGLGKKIYMDVIQISSRFYSLSRQNQNGLLSNNEYIEQLNRINYAILSILDELPKRTL